ncbi:MAG: zinc ABC transporter substrate-binding protein [Lachnospiraceae bacterium]|nr:zinc ABC transporter substrate-binding protein [Lachnospiraceae bacterium]
MRFKKRKKRGLVLLLAAVLLASVLSGCGASRDRAGSGASDKGTRLQVVTTIFPQYDFARYIGGDRADVHMLLKPGEEIHSYEPTPQDIRLIQNSDLFIYVGGENDVWVDNILKSVGEDGPRAVRLLDLAGKTYAEQDLEGMMPERGGHEHSHEDHDAHAETEAETAHEAEAEEDHAHEETETETAHETGEEDHDHAEDAAEEDHSHHAGGRSHADEPDEHVWTSPENCVTLIAELTDIFCETDPENAAVYRANGDDYRRKFEDLDRQYLEMAARARRKTILFGDRFPFRYLAEELGLTCYAAFSGCSSDSEPNAATIAFLINKAAEEELPVVFKIEFSNGNIAEAICEAAQVRADRRAARTQSGAEPPRMQVLQLHSCHNVTRDEFESGQTCLSLMKKNLKALETALGAGQ